MQRYAVKKQKNIKIQNPVFCLDVVSSYNVMVQMTVILKNFVTFSKEADIYGKRTKKHLQTKSKIFVRTS